MTSIAPRGVGIWGAPLHGGARAEWFAPVPPQEYNRNRLQGTNRNHVPSGRAPAGRRAPSASIPSGTPVARASWSQPVPPEKYNTRRLVGSNTKRVPDSQRRTAATVAALMQGEAPAGLLSKMGPLPKMANVTEVMAGLKAALDTSADEKERAHITDMIETLRPIVVISARRGLTPEEQAIVDDVAQKLLGEAHEEVAAQAGEERAHQAARAAEFSKIEGVAKSKAGAEREASEARGLATNAAEAARRMNQDLEALGLQAAREEAAAAEAMSALGARDAILASQFDNLRLEADRARKERAALEIEKANALRERDQLAKESRAARADAKRASAEAHAYGASREEQVDAANAAEALERQGESLANAAEGAAARAKSMEAAAADRLRKARGMEQDASKVKREAGQTRKELGAVARAIKLARREIDRAGGALTAAARKAAADAVEADEVAEQYETEAAAAPSAEAPKLPARAPRARRRARAEAARAEEEARAVRVIRGALDPMKAMAAEALGRMPAQAGPREEEEERKESTPPAERLRDLPLQGIKKNEVQALLQLLEVEGRDSLRRSGVGVPEGLDLLEAAAARGTVGAGVLRQVAANLLARPRRPLTHGLD